MTLWFRALCLLIITIQNAQAADDGHWQLTISGVDRIEFGTEKLAGGLIVKWETVLDFTIKDGSFISGTGTAKLKPEIKVFSRPAEFLNCEQVIGTFANRSGLSFSTPHLRYRAFPVTGKLENKVIQLNPYLEYPGNYFAVLYKCSTQSELGEFWIERAPRVSRELSKRQDSNVDHKDGVFSASIKEVKSIAPGLEVRLPLTNGLSFNLQQDYGLRELSYRLAFLGDNR